MQISRPHVLNPHPGPVNPEALDLNQRVKVTNKVRVINKVAGVDEEALMLIRTLLSKASNVPRILEEGDAGAVAAEETYEVGAAAAAAAEEEIGSRWPGLPPSLEMIPTPPLMLTEIRGWPSEEPSSNYRRKNTEKSLISKNRRRKKTSVSVARVKWRR